MELSEIRDTLRKSEDSIIFALLERARWKRNSHIYKKLPSLFNDLLVKTEKVHAEVGRYQCPEEHPFTNIPDVSIQNDAHQDKQYYLTSVLHKDHRKINHNDTILETYLCKILPQITLQGEDENSGSATVADINLLQAISRRIHLGKVVAEVKLNEPGARQAYRQCDNPEDYMSLLTNQKVEDLILKRVGEKAELYDSESCLSSDTVTGIFRDFIIPYTKKVQVDYLQITTK
jgi:chorismate mutase